jgi:hypothetical protein
MRPVRRVDKLTTFIAECLEIWKPQPPGTLRACTGMALPLHLQDPERDGRITLKPIGSNGGAMQGRWERVRAQVKTFFAGPPSKSGSPKNVYTKSGRLAVNCRVTWAWSERFKFVDRMGYVTVDDGSAVRTCWEVRLWTVSTVLCRIITWKLQ